LLAKLDTFLTATGAAWALSYAGTGNGTLTAYKGGASSIAETFVITATDATHFSVVGSTSGSLGTATAGVTFSHAKLTFLITVGGTAFVAGDAFSLSTAPPWTRKRGAPSASSTQWRVNIIATAGGLVPRLARVEMFDTLGGADQVTGGTATASSSNASHLPADAADVNSATYWECGTPSGWWQYTFGSAKAIKEIAITYPTGQSNDNNGPADFRVEYFDGTSWVPAGSWRNDTGWVSTERRVYRLASYIWQAPGNGGTEQILVGVSPFQNAATGFYNWRLNGYTAYDAAADWFSQPGVIATVSPYGPIIPLSNGSLGYWFVSNGRRVVGVVKSSSTYGAFYLGLIQPYASPGQWPLPLFVGGALWWDVEPVFTDARWTVGNAHTRHTCFPLPFSPLLNTAALIAVCGSARLRKPDGTWRGFMARSDFYDPKEDANVLGRVWPYAYDFSNLKPDLDGLYPVFPVIYHEVNATGGDNWFGQPDGVFAVSGSGLSAEATLDERLQAATATPKRTYVAFPDTTRSTAGDFFAMLLD
jgi:hypothetical protein